MYLSTVTEATMDPTNTPISKGRVVREAPRKTLESVEVLATRKMGLVHRVLHLKDVSVVPKGVPLPVQRMRRK
jgi:hypothetical protein